jgi:S1-C subfamily serine protease
MSGKMQYLSCYLRSVKPWWRAGKGSSSGIGFAIPIDTVKGLVDQILTYGKVVRPVLGITIAPPQTLRQQQQEGVLVLEVQEGSAAEKAGIKGTFR